jgi:hypothetical protein
MGGIRVKDTLGSSPEYSISSDSSGALRDIVCVPPAPPLGCYCGDPIQPLVSTQLNLVVPPMNGVDLSLQPCPLAKAGSSSSARLRRLSSDLSRGEAPVGTRLTMRWGSKLRPWVGPTRSTCLEVKVGPGHRASAAAPMRGGKGYDNGTAWDVDCPDAAGRACHEGPGLQPDPRHHLQSCQ